MNLSNLTSDSLKSLVNLTKKKDVLLQELEKIESQLVGLFSGKAPKVSGKRRGRPSKKGNKTSKKAPKAAKAKRSPRGTIGKKVLKALESAGEVGVKVADLAKTLKVKGTSLHVWFATTGKKNKGIKKVGKGHYRLSK
jgi:hypothetical protein